MFISLMIFSLFMVISITQSNNSQNINKTFISNSRINSTYGNFQNNLNSIGEDSNSQFNKFKNSSAKTGLLSIIIPAIVGAGNTFSNMIIGTFSTLTELPVVFLGLDPIVVSIINGVLVLLILMALWAVYKLGG
ncbi:MAG TPA: hypothetical protein ENK59_09275 [Thioploca sp.]|nr:hypothetical protein [Thioploca sp.]